MIIKRIDQRDEPTCLRFQLQIKLRDVSYDDRVEILSQLKVVTSGESPVAKLIEARVQNLSAGLLKRNISSEVGECLGANCVILLTAQYLEDCVELAFMVWIGFPKRRKIKLLNRKLDGNSQKVVLALAFVSGSVVNTRIEFTDLTVAFEDRDEWDEIAERKKIVLYLPSRLQDFNSPSLKSIFIQVVGFSVAGCYDNNSIVE